MKTPVKIEFQGLATSAETSAAINRHVNELEERYGRATACRVTVKGPGAHHRMGGLYEVSIHLALPNGREVNVSRTKQSDERHSDLTFSIANAFKRARRQLQDKARRMRSDMKQHEGQAIGKVVRLDQSGEFGFIADDNGREIYFHRNSVLDERLDRLTIGARVIFVEEAGEKGPQASTMKLLGKHAMRV